MCFIGVLDVFDGYRGNHDVGDVDDENENSGHEYEQLRTYQID